MLFWPLFTCIKNHKWFGLGFLRYYIPIQNKSVNRPINRSQSSRAIIKSEKFTMLSLFEENTPNTGKILLSKLKNLNNIRCGSWIRAHIILSERRLISNEHIYMQPLARESITILESIKRNDLTLSLYICPKYYGDPSVVKHDWIIA